MTRPITTSRLVLIEDRRAAGDPTAAFVPRRRYRLARVSPEGPATSGKGRFSYLKRSHD